MKKKLASKALAIALAGGMALSSTPVATFADMYDEYTQANMANDGGAGGTVFGDNGTVKNEDGTAIKFNTNTDYTDDSFQVPASVTENLQETSYNDAYDKDDIVQMDEDQLEETIDALLNTMTYAEKLRMVSMNSDPEDRNGVGYMSGVPRLGIPETRMHDGPAGVSTSGDSYVETTNPANQLTASQSWSTDVAEEIGQIYGSEQVSIGSGWQLGTQADIARNPFWARNKDTWGEDYCLSSAMVVAQHKGVQEEGGLAMTKHIGAYATDGDTSLWLRVDEQTLHTTYLSTFEAAAKEAKTASIMGTYNRLNGFYISSNYHLQVEILRDMWNWEGSMVPDWGADKEELSMLLGTDISQSGWSSIDRAFRSACSQGLATMDTLDTAVRHSLWSLGICGYLNEVELDGNGYVKQDLSRSVYDEEAQSYTSDYDEEGYPDRIQFQRTYTEDVANGLLEENNEKALDAAEKSIVLLKNDNGADGEAALPLTEEDYTGDNHVALMGYGAVELIGGTGGERSFGVLQYMETPSEALNDIVGEDANVDSYILGDIHGVSIPNVYADEDMTTAGWEMKDELYYGNVKSSGGGWGWPGMVVEPEVEEEVTEPYTGETRIVDDVHLVTTTNGRSFKNDETGNALENGEEAEWIGYIKAPSTGSYSFVIASNGGTAKVVVKGLDDDVNKNATVSGGVTWDNYTTEGLGYSTVTVNLTEGNEYKIMVDAQQTDVYRAQGVKLGWITPTKADEDLEAAVAAAKVPNTKVVYFSRTGATGHGPVFQTDFDISLDEVDRIKTVQAAAKEAGNDFVLVTFSRSAYSFEGDWLDDTDALVNAYYPGQTAGRAIAEILTGEVNPSAKTTLSMPKTNNDTLLTYGYYSEDSTSGNNYNKRLAGDQSNGSYVAYYDEGQNIGYHFYDETEGAEYQYPFGYGLSYTTFEYSNLQVKDNGDGTFTATVDVTNTGDVAGSEIVEMYIDSDTVEVPDSVQMVQKQLVSWDRLEDIQPGETETATMDVSQRMLSYWYADMELTQREDDTQDKWVVADGSRTLMVGNSSDNLTLEAEIEVAPKAADTTGIEAAIADLTADGSAAAVAAAKAAQVILDANAGATEDEAQKLFNEVTAAANDILAGEDTDAALVTIAAAATEQAAAEAAEAADLLAKAQAAAEAADASAAEAVAKAEAAAEKANAAAASAEEAAAAATSAEAAAARAEAAEVKAESAQTLAEAAQLRAETAEANVQKLTEEAKAYAEEAKAAAKELNAVKKIAKFIVKKVSAALKASNKKVSVTIKAVAGAEKYTVKYAYNSKFTNAKKVSTTKTTVTLKNLKSGKKLYVKVRAYRTVGGTNVYTGYSKVKSVKVK